MLSLFNTLLEDKKQFRYATRKISGLGKKTTADLCYILGLSNMTRTNQLKIQHINKIKTLVRQKHPIKAELVKKVKEDIQKQISIGTYKGLRHVAGLPVRGQRTRSNSQTQRRLNASRFSNK